MNRTLQALLALAVVALPLPAAADSEARWQFESRTLAGGEVVCEASVQGWMPRGEGAARLGVSWGEGITDIFVKADRPVGGLVLVVRRADELTGAAEIRADAPGYPGMGSATYAKVEDLLPALRAGSLATIDEADPEPGDPPIYAFSLAGSSAAIGKLLECRR